MVTYRQFGKMKGNLSNLFADGRLLSVWQDKLTAAEIMRITEKSEGEIFHQNNSLGFDSIEDKFLPFFPSFLYSVFSFFHFCRYHVKQKQVSASALPSTLPSIHFIRFPWVYLCYLFCSFVCDPQFRLSTFFPRVYHNYWTGQATLVFPLLLLEYFTKSELIHKGAYSF